MAALRAKLGTAKGARAPSEAHKHNAELSSPRRPGRRRWRRVNVGAERQAGISSELVDDKKENLLLRSFLFCPHPGHIQPCGNTHPRSYLSKTQNDRPKNANRRI